MVRAPSLELTMGALNQVLLMADNPGGNDNDDAGVEALHAGADDDLAKQSAASLLFMGFAALRQADQHHPLPASHQLRLQIIARSARGMDERITGSLTSDPGHAMQWQIDPVLSAPGDPRLVEVLLINLLGNAWKYSAKAAPAAIHFGALPVPAQAVLPTCFVRDNGIGFDPSDARKYFTPFHRLPAASAYAGSGVGLATVRRAAERHGGSACAETQPGAGACSCFTLQSEPARTGQS